MWLLLGTLVVSPALAADVEPTRAAVSGAVGIPNLLSVRVEGFVASEWSVEGAVGIGLTWIGFEAGPRWRPDVLCIGCDGRTSLALGLGTTFWGGPTGQTVALIWSLDLDLMFRQHFSRRAGLMLGTRWGLGPTIEVPWDRFRIEPAGNFTLLRIGAFF